MVTGLVPSLCFIIKIYYFLLFKCGHTSCSCISHNIKDVAHGLEALLTCATMWKSCLLLQQSQEIIKRWKISLLTICMIWPVLPCLFEDSCWSQNQMAHFHTLKTWHLPQNWHLPQIIRCVILFISQFCQLQWWFTKNVINIFMYLFIIGQQTV